MGCSGNAVSRSGYTVEYTFITGTAPTSFVAYVTYAHIAG